MNISKIVIGTWSLSGDFGPVTLDTVSAVLESAYEKGFKEFDTAPVYGNGFMEFCLGKVFYRCPEVLINTKVGNLPFVGKSFALNDLKRSVEESLKRLGGLPINVLFLHNPREEIKDYAPVIEYLRDLKKKGIIKAIGLSKAKEYPYEKKVDLNEFDVVQDDLNLLYLEPLNSLGQSQPAFMARSPLASGLLSGKISAETVFHPTDHRSEWLKGERLRSLLKRVQAIKDLAPDMDVASLAKRFLLSNNKVDKIIFGVKSQAHVNDLIDDLKKPALSGDLVNKFIELYRQDFGLANEGQYKY